MLQSRISTTFLPILLWQYSCVGAPVLLPQEHPHLAGSFVPKFRAPEWLCTTPLPLLTTSPSLHVCVMPVKPKFHVPFFFLDCNHNCQLVHWTTCGATTCCPPSPSFSFCQVMFPSRIYAQMVREKCHSVRSTRSSVVGDHCWLA